MLIGNFDLPHSIIIKMRMPSQAGRASPSYPRAVPMAIGILTRITHYTTHGSINALMQDGWGRLDCNSSLDKTD